MFPKHLRRTVGVVVSSVSLLLKRVLVLPPKHLRREGRSPPPPPPPPPPTREEEEEEEMVDLVHNFGTRKRKQGANFKRATGATPKVVGEASQQPSGESSDVQATVNSNSPEMGFHGQLASKTALLVDLGEVSPTHTEVQEDIPSEYIVGRSEKAKSTRAGRSRPLLLDRLLLNSYIPSQSQAPPMEEVSVPGPEGA